MIYQQYLFGLTCCLISLGSHGKPVKKYESGDVKDIAFYSMLIRDKIMRNWIDPKQKGEVPCTIKFRLAKAGDVLSVDFTECNENQEQRDSAIKAIYKASPFPVPTDEADFQKLRNINIIFG